MLWGLGGALSSGTLEALLYDSLRDPDRYARIAGRGGTVAILSMLVATLLAGPVHALGGYLLIGALSTAVAAIGGLLALGFDESRGDGPGDEPLGYLGTLRAGLRHVRAGRRVAWALALAALVPGFTALDEYLPLVTRAAGVPITYVPLFFAVPEVFAVVLYAFFGLGSAYASIPLLFAVAGASLLATAAVAAAVARVSDDVVTPAGRPPAC